MKEKNLRIKKILFSEQEIESVVKQIALQINKALKQRGVKSLTVLCVLRGAFVFTADLVRRIDIEDIRIEFISASSYFGGTESSGSVNIGSLNDIEIKGKNILVVEDIVDTGRTLSKLVDTIKSENPANVWVTAMFDKPDRRVVDFNADFVGAVIPDEFIVGYGLDYDGKYRALPYAAVLGYE